MVKLHRRNELTRLRTCACWILVSLVGTTLSATADDRRDNLAMGQLARTIAKSVDGSVVQIKSGNRLVALGTVVDPDGYILTKRSELSNNPISVRLHDGRLIPARVAAVRRQNDLALLKIDIDDPLTPVEFSDVSPPLASFLISPGRNGQPVGIGVVGARPRPISHDVMLGVQLTDYEGQVQVKNVIERSGAAEAGITRGDVIVAIDGVKTYTGRGVTERLRESFPGERVQLTILRQSEDAGEETLELTARLRDKAVIAESESDMKVNGARSARLSGFQQVVQHDTFLEPDECGGPALDTAGRVVGVNIARAGRVVSYLLPSALVTAEVQSMLDELNP